MIFETKNRSVKTSSSFFEGYLLVLVLVFGAIFFAIVTSFVGSLVTQSKLVAVRVAEQKAAEIAEAGLNYYKWRLAHYPDDVTDGTGAPGPYVHVYSDPEDGPIGEFSLSIASTTYCGDIASIEVTSVGTVYGNVKATSSVTARYSRPTVADYSFITNGATWYGSSRVITGPVHSNQGIRMDGQHNSYVGSGVSSWTCTASFGCSPDQTVDGIYTTSGLATPGLFSFPVSPVDFVGLTLDLAQMKTKAQTGGGIYLPPSGSWGYKLNFNGDGTITVRKVTGTYSYWAYSTYEGWHTSERNVITSLGSPTTYTINSSCPLIYVEDKLWLQGDVSQKVAVAAANLSSGAQTNIVIGGEDTVHGNLRYVPNTDAGLLAIAEDDIDIGLQVPTDMEADGIFVAQNGRFGVNFYYPWYFPGWLRPYICRNSLTRYGSVVSNGRVGTSWGSNFNYCGTYASGFANRFTSFDANQVDDPPPFTPNTSDVYELTNWKSGH